MFRSYGFIGIFMVIFAQLNFILKIQPFAQWYFPIIWFGYIFIIDAINYKLNGRSLMMNEPKVFLFLLISSSVIWWMFEYIGFVLNNWYYAGLEGFGSRLEIFAFGTISFSTVIPTVFETAILLRSVHLFDEIKLTHRHRISKKFLYTMIGLGIVSLIGPLMIPYVLYPIIWVSFFLILDPINYLHGRPSIINHLQNRNLTFPLAIFIGATVCGFLWEFWNFWAIPKWYYTIPFVDFLKVFEMPILGYIGYGPFGLELYAMFNFLMGLVNKREVYIFKF